MFQIKSTGFLNPLIRIRVKYLRMRNMTSEMSGMALDLYLPCMNELFFLSRWMYLILGNFLALNRRENLDKISWFVLLLDSGVAHLSTCTFRYKNKTENLCGARGCKLQNQYIPYIASSCSVLRSWIRDPGLFWPLHSGSLFWPLDPGSGMEKNPEPGSGIRDEHSDLIFGSKILKLFDADPDPGSCQSWIRGGNKSDPQHCTC